MTGFLKTSSSLFVALFFFFSSPAFASYTATGSFQYQDREFNLNGFTGNIVARPIRFATVRIMAGATTLATGTTNAAGLFSILVPGSTAQSITALCVATSVAPGPLLDVRVANDDFTFGDFYALSSAAVNSPGTGTVDMGTTLAMANTDIGKAFNIWDVINDGLEAVASPFANGSLPTAKLTVIWRSNHTRTGSFFQSGTNRYIYMGVNAAYDDTISSHEFGHYVDNIFSKSDSPGGAHFLGDNNQDIRLSWGEGLATFLGSSIRKFKGYPQPEIYVNTDGTNLSFSYEIESLTGNIALASKTGSTNEAAVTAALWDITDGSGTDTTGVFRPSNGALYLKATNASGFADAFLTYGLPGDYPVTGDWNGDGVDTIGIYRNGSFYLRNSNTNGFADIVFAYGAPGDQPVAGDWNGDGTTTIGVYRNGTFFLRNSNTSGAPDIVFDLGIPGDIGIAGDWDGNGTVTTGVFRPSNGALYLKNSNATGFADVVLTYGLPGDLPVTGDWNGDGIDTIGVYRGGTFFLRDSNTNGFADHVFALGIPGDYPIAGRWGIPSITSLEPSGEQRGPFAEDSDIAAAPVLDDDQLQRPFTDVWKVLNSHLPTVTAPGISIEDFWDGWFSPSINNGALAKMQTIFVNLNGIEFAADAFEADNTSGTAPLVTAAPVPALASGAKVLLNEAELGAVDAVELFNAGNAPAELTGWKIVATRSGFTTATLVIPSFVLAPGAFVILSEASGTNTNTVLYLGTNIPWANDVDGSCALLDNSNAGKDFVRWGGSLQAPPTGTSFTGNAASPGLGKALCRKFGVADSDSSNDWTDQASTLGTFNFTGQEKHHTYYPAGDVDFAAFNATSGKNYLVETLNLLNGSDTVIDLLSTNGTTLLATSDDLGALKASRITWTAPSTGKFFVRSRRFDGPSNPAQYGSYDLRILESSTPFPAVLPQTLTVSLPGQGGQYQSITAAIAVAGSGDTIQILDNGPYLESPAVTAKSLTLKAASGKNPILDGRNSAAFATLNLTNAKLVRIEGLIILGGLRGIRVSGGQAIIKNTVVIHAVDPSGFADGIQVSGDGTSATIINSTVTGNGRLGIGVFTGATARVVNCIVKNNTLNDISGNVAPGNYVVRNTLLATASFLGSNGNINGDPGFVDAAHDNYRLLSSSIAIDKGDPSDPDLPATDAVGNSRSIDGDGNGSAIPDMGAYEYKPPALDPVSVLAQVAAGGGYQTSIIGINTGIVSASVDLSLTRSDGRPFPAMDLSRGIAGSKAGTSSIVSIAPMGAARLETAVPVHIVSGYAKFLSSQPVNGSALLRLVNGSKILSEAGVGLSKPSRNFTIYLDNLNNAQSGYAVANTGTEPASLTLTLRNSRGSAIEVRGFTLPSGQHIAEFASQRFANHASPGFEGSIEFSSDQNVAAVALRFDNVTQDVFSTIPVLVDEAAATLFFPQVADGNGYRTNIVLVNPNESPTTAKLEFFAHDGTPLMVPFGGSLKTTFDLPLSAKGVARMITDGTSPEISVGWVRVTSQEPIGGAAIFQTRRRARIISEAGVASSPLAPHFTTYVESLGFAESGLAVCNPNAAGAEVTLRLRNSAGEVVASTSLNLPARAHFARFFTEFFPEFGEFEGTLELLATAPVGGVALRFDNEEGDVFATLPVIVIP